MSTVCEDQQSVVHFSTMGRLICDQRNWEAALHKVPGAPARGTERSLVPVVHLQLQHNLKHVTEGQEERMHST